MPGKISPSSNSKSSPVTNIVNWIPIGNYLTERCFPHLFKLTIQQMRLQRALIRFLADEGEPNASKSSSFGVSLKASIIEEKKRLLRLLKHHVSTLHSIEAPYLVIEEKVEMVEAVEESLKELRSTEPEDILKSTFEELSNSILGEYLDLVTNFVGDDSNWPIGQDGDGDERLVNKMLRF